jgi:ParB family chromosome partitioning protein
MPFEKRKIILDTIDSTDHTFRISSSADPVRIDALADSIDRLGLFQAPMIHESGSQRRIISGFRRIEACQHLGLKAVLCRIPGPKISARQCAQLAVAENAWQRSLDLMEKARAFALLMTFNPEATSLSNIARPLGLVENSTLIDKLIHLTRLPDAIQAAVEAGVIGMAMALMLGELETEESHQLLALFQTFQFGLNRQREVLELIREIAKRESITIGRLLGSNKIKAILNRTDQDRPARGNTLRIYLKKRRYPALTEMEETFMQLEKKLGFGGPMARMVPPPYFEGKTYQLTMKFGTIAELKAHHQRLEKMIGHPDLNAFLDG